MKGKNLIQINLTKNFKMINSLIKMLCQLSNFNKRKKNNIICIFKIKLKKLVNKNGMNIKMIQITLILHKMKEINLADKIMIKSLLANYINLKTVIILKRGLFLAFKITNKKKLQ